MPVHFTNHKSIRIKEFNHSKNTDNYKLHFILLKNQIPKRRSKSSKNSYDFCPVSKNTSGPDDPTQKNADSAKKL